MRYLVIAQPTGATPNVPPQQFAQMLDTVVVPSVDMLATWEREGRIHGGSFVGRRGGCFIIDAASNEELAGLLMTLPFWGLQDWTITPLTSDEAAAKRFRELSQRLKSTGQRVEQLSSRAAE